MQQVEMCPNPRQDTGVPWGTARGTKEHLEQQGTSGRSPALYTPTGNALRLGNLCSMRNT